MSHLPKPVLVALFLVALCLLLAGCATTEATRPQVIFTPQDELVIKVETRCYRVSDVDYRDPHASPDDLAYGNVVAVPCPVRRR